MDWPQIVSIVWAGAMLGIGIANHGKPFPVGKWSVWLVALRVALYGCLLWAGGFYTVAQAQVPQPALQYRPLLTRTAHAVWGLDAPVAVFAAQVHQESAWRPGAVSHVGAQGLAQFMPATTQWIAGLHPDLATQQPYNPAWALRALVTYDLWLYERTPARYDPFDRMWVALRAYNGGLGHWQAEARGLGVRLPSRVQVDAACGTARRAAVHCRENLGYPHRILVVLQPRYLQWGLGL